MCSRKRKYLKKLQVFICLVTLSSTVRCDEEVREIYTHRDNKRIAVSLGDANGNATSFNLRAMTPIRDRDEDDEDDDLSRSRVTGSSPIKDVSNRGFCPPSCFCEKEAGYAACVGDGQWAPPSLPAGLTRVELRGFFIPELGPTQLKVLPAIRELQINHCNLSLLLDDTFVSLQELDGLDLSENQLSRLGLHSLRGLKSLRHLDLSVNRLSVLEKPFIELASLQHLNLHHNSLRSLNQDTFQGLSRVQYIDLDSNEISFLEVSAFQHLTSLAHLILSNNQLSSLATLDFFGSRLQYIDLSNIGISRVPQALTQFVRDLRLARNVITEIHRGDLDSYPYLTLLVLDNNNVEVLEEDALGRHEYLSRLWLNGNNLVSIPLSLPPSLQALYLDENSVSGIHDGDFRGLINLQQLSLQHNNISVIAECAFCELLKLKVLNLQGNLLTNLTGRIFSHLSNLEDLDLSQNPLISLDGDALLGLTSLRSLQMSHIQTEQIEIPDTLFDSLKGLWILEMCESPKLASTFVNKTKMLRTLRGLRELNIMHNGLTELRSDFASFFPQLQTIKLSGNTWDCTSPEKIRWLKRWMEHSSVNFYRSYSVRCASPLSVSYKPVILLEESDFKNSDALVSPNATASATAFSMIFNLTFDSDSMDPKVENVTNKSNVTSEYFEYSTIAGVNRKSIEPVTFHESEENDTDDNVKANSSVMPTSNPEIVTQLSQEKQAEGDTLVLFPTEIPTFNANDHNDSKDDVDKDVDYKNVEDGDDSDENKTVVQDLSITPREPPSSTELNPFILSTLKENRVFPEVTTSTDLPSTRYEGLLPKESRSDLLDQVLFKDLASDEPEKERTPVTSVKPVGNTIIQEITLNFTELLKVKEKEKEKGHVRSSGTVTTKDEMRSVTFSEKLPQVPAKQENKPHEKKVLQEIKPHHKDLWLYRGDSNHGLNSGPLLPLGFGHGRVSDEALAFAGIVATFLGIALFVAGFLVAQGRAKAGSSWESSSLSSTYWRDGSGEDEVLMAVEEDSGSTENSSLSQAENGGETDHETQAGLNSRLYFLLQRDSCTGITPDSLPDPRNY